MAEMEIDYRGYTIKFSENQEVWRCWSLDVESEKLRTIKTKIDKVITAARKLQNPLPVILVDYDQKITPVTILSLAQPRAGHEPDTAWCMVPKQERYFDHTTKANVYREVHAREKKRLDSLFIDTPENRAALAEIERLHAEISQLQKERKRVAEGMTKVGASVFKIEDAADPEKTDA